MENKYIELYKISIDEVYDFCPLQLRKMIKKKSIFSLGQLIEMVETKDVINEFVNMKLKSNDDAIFQSYQSIMGTIKMFKYKYLGIDPDFNYNCTLEQLGFSSAIARNIEWILRNEYYKSNNINSIFKILDDEVIKKRFIDDFLKSSYGPTGKEFSCKLPVLEKYFKEKEKGVSLKVSNEELKNEKTIFDANDVDIKELYEQLEFLLKQHKLLSEQIIIVQDKINEKIKERITYGTNRKK